MKFKVNQRIKTVRTHCVPSIQFKASGSAVIYPIRWIVPPLLLAIFTVGFIQVSIAIDDARKSTQEEIRTWIDDLGSDDYATRQVAGLRLSKCTEEAIPFLVQAASNATGEKADRVFQFLSSTASDPYSDSGKLAFDSLNQLAAVRTTSKAIRAEKILQVIGAEQREAAIRMLDELKAPIRDREVQVMSSKALLKQPLVIDRKFTGTAEDLACLKWLTDIEFVRLEGPQISRATLKHIISLPHLKKLQLVETDLNGEDLAVLKDAPDLDLLEFVYTPIGDESVDLLLNLPVWGNLYLFGSKLTQSGQQALHSRLDGVELFLSRGGFLGVQALGNSSIINEVVSGGAAEAAGLQNGDKMLSVNGIPIQLFDDLRKQLAKFADGETVIIELERRVRVTDGLQKDKLQNIPQNIPQLEFPMRGAFERKKLQFAVTLGKRTDITRDR